MEIATNNRLLGGKSLKVVNNILGPLLWTLRELDNGGQFYVIHPDI